MVCRRENLFYCCLTCVTDVDALFAWTEDLLSLHHGGKRISHVWYSFCFLGEVACLNELRKFLKSKKYLLVVWEILIISKRRLCFFFLYIFTLTQNIIVISRFSCNDLIILVYYYYYLKFNLNFSRNWWIELQISHIMWFCWPIWIAARAKRSRCEVHWHFHYSICNYNNGRVFFSRTRLFEQASTSNYK